jgi:hypothetical protein
MNHPAPESPPAPLRRVLYVATARKPFTREDLAALLAKSLANNERDDITGMLLYRDSLFIQALEGPPDAIRALLARIRDDSRIISFDPIDDSESRDRVFPDWRMAFRNLDDPGIAAHPGFSDFMNAPRTVEKILPSDPSNYWRTLDHYRRQL